MRPLLTDILHIFVIFMMGSFVILCVVGATGEFDKWTQRLNKRQKKAPAEKTEAQQ